MGKRLLSVGLTVLAVTLVVPTASMAAGLTVLTVPWDPTNSLTPHTTYPINRTTESTTVLGATAPSAAAGDSLSVTWVFGDGSPNATFTTTNMYDLSTTHQYPPSAAPGTAWTAVITVNDTTAGTSGTANFYVAQSVNSLSSRVNVAIDRGLWYMHQTMWRTNTPANGQPVNIGGWDGYTGSPGCNTVYDPTYSENLAWDCYYTGVIDGNNVQALEVSGHKGTDAGGPATDPFTDDVDRGIARVFEFLGVTPAITNKYLYNPAAVNYGCSDGSSPSNTGVCTLPATPVYYNASSTTCTSPPCSFLFDSNSNGNAIYSADGSGEVIYTGGPFVDAIVASAAPTATAKTGVAGVIGQTYATIVSDMLDYYAGCQYENDYDGTNPLTPGGYIRGESYSAQGGGWLYSCQEGDDNSTSQWAAISFVSGERGSGFGFNSQALANFTVVQDFNNVWVTDSEDIQNAAPTGPDPYNTTGDDRGSFGYRGSFYYSNAWGAFAVTPSGMVQMAMDGIGRTTNTAFGDATTAPDQRWNEAETFYADNFCNTETSAYNNPKYYTYGMLSFTKSMLLHDPNGSLAPIQYLRTSTPSVFTGNPSVPTNTIDWYAALTAASHGSGDTGGNDACNGIAQTLVNYQDPTGFWYGHDYYEGYQSDQSPFETAWSIIMLKKTVFVQCVKNLAGRGNPSGQGGSQITLTWSGQANATGYNILKSSSQGGPYTQVGTSTVTSYRDGNDGMLPGQTWYYVVQPLQGTTEVCQSNEAKVIIP